MIWPSKRQREATGHDHRPRSSASAGGASPVVGGCPTSGAAPTAGAAALVGAGDSSARGVPRRSGAIAARARSSGRGVRRSSAPAASSTTICARWNALRNDREPAVQLAAQLHLRRFSPVYRRGRLRRDRRRGPGERATPPRATWPSRRWERRCSPRRTATGRRASPWWPSGCASRVTAAVPPRC